MNVGEIAEIFVRELGWNAAAFVVTAVVAIIVMRLVFGLGISQVIHEVEEDQNAGVGAAFFIIALLSSLWFGKIAGEFGNQVSLREQLAWSAFGFVIATIVFAVAFNLVFRVLAHRKGESMITYLRREGIEEDNAALILFVGSLAVVPYTLAAMITV